MLDIEIDDAEVLAKYEVMPNKLRSSVKKKIYYLVTKLEQNVKQGLQGAVLKYRSGELYASIYGNVVDNQSEITGKVASSASSKAAPYARIQEFGGTTKPHVIEAVNGKALRFNMGGKEVFFTKVNHPGSVIPAAHYIGGPFDAMKGEIALSLKEASEEGMQ